MTDLFTQNYHLKAMRLCPPGSPRDEEGTAGVHMYAEKRGSKWGPTFFSVTHACSPACRGKSLAERHAGKGHACSQWEHFSPTNSHRPTSNVPTYSSFSQLSRKWYWNLKFSNLNLNVLIVHFVESHLVTDQESCNGIGNNVPYCQGTIRKKNSHTFFFSNPGTKQKYSLALPPTVSNPHLWELCSTDLLLHSSE